MEPGLKPTSLDNTARLRTLDCEHVWHPFTPMSAYRTESAPIIESGEGFYLIDTDGKRYLDGVGSLWCNIHGHRAPQIDEAIRRQLDRIAHSTLLGLGNVPSIALAAELVRRTHPNLTKVFYSDDGATAVEVALKMAFQYQRQRAGGDDQRNTFICLGGAYHGDTLGAVSVGGVDRFHAVFRPLLFPTIQVPSPVAYRTPPGFDRESYLAFCFAELERTIEKHADSVAGMVIEPLVQGAAGILVHPPGYLRRARELTRKHGILLIADEVAVGCGRTGFFLACRHEEVQPDLLCLAKGLTGGYLPLAATLATDQIFEAFLGEAAAGRTFFHGHTYTGNPLGCAAALASLTLLDTNRVLENVRANEALLRERFREWAAWPHVGEIRHKGMMCGIELVEDQETKAPYPATRRVGHQVCLAARRHGVFIRPLGDVVVLMPPLAMPAAVVHQLCDVVGDAIREVTKHG